MRLSVKHILLFIILLLPFGLSAQTKEDFQRIYEELKAKGYDIDEDKARSFFEENIEDISVNDSISKIMLILDKERTKYKTMEEAEMEVEQLLSKVAKDRNSYQRRNGALAVRIGENAIIRNKERDRVARDAWTDLVKKKEASTEDFVALYEKFGDRPTYYVNGIEVDQHILNKLRDSDVMEREYRVKNTASGNPNGEVWYTITKKAMKRIGLYTEEELPVEKGKENIG
ncbi:hypothetical protein [Dysgonomonas massiliensis]|uniref:hypothetical protein n=1 Tax=Dysgonomonas massiliensis TaxID=2040292 RepID=UPI000C78A585|nr:hypothetical protein [Dysgonomonas massiliensis]